MSKSAVLTGVMSAAVTTCVGAWRLMLLVKSKTICVATIRGRLGSKTVHLHDVGEGIGELHENSRPANLFTVKFLRLGLEASPNAHAGGGFHADGPVKSCK